MHGGVKVYRGRARGAREYLDQDCPRVEDYYLAEPGPSRSGTPSTPTGTLSSWPGWMATRTRRGSPASTPTLLSHGAGCGTTRAVRFVEVTMNGPKSWSLTAELHPDMAAAYDAAQDRAAEQIIGWLGQHATARVGPRGQQVATVVEILEAVTVRHGYTLTGSGEITQLVPYVGAFSKRAAQIERKLARYEKAWRVEHPGEEPWRTSAQDHADFADSTAS